MPNLYMILPYDLLFLMILHYGYEFSCMHSYDIDIYMHSYYDFYIYAFL